MSQRQKYDFERLDNYCKENNVTLLEDYKNLKINRETSIKGNCVYKNCENIFEKKFRAFLNFGGYCFNCIKIVSKERIKKTCLMKYNCENPFQNKNIKELIKHKCLLKYGCEYANQSIIVKQKIKKQFIEKWGVEHISQNEKIKENKIKTNMKNWHVNYPLQNKIIQEKFKKTCLKKYGVKHISQDENIKNKKIKTYLKKYGYENPSQSEEIKNKKIKTSIKNWGFEYPCQNSEIMEKNVKSNFKRKEYIFPSGRVEKIQGYENFALDELIINEKIDESDIIVGVKNVPEIWYNDINGKKHRHYVDIFIPSQNKCIEVKSTWTFTKSNVLLKQKAGKELGYNYEIWIYDKNGNKTFYDNV